MAYILNPDGLVLINSDKVNYYAALECFEDEDETKPKGWTVVAYFPSATSDAKWARCSFMDTEEEALQYLISLHKEIAGVWPAGK